MVLEDGSHGYSTVRVEFSRPVLVLMGIVAIIFLIACANLASLLFVRVSRRSGPVDVVCSFLDPSVFIGGGGQRRMELK